MNPKFKNVKVIAWDVDTTLYQNIPELSLKFKNECVKEVAKAKNISPEAAVKIFALEREKYGSSTMALMKLGVGNPDTIEKIQAKIGKSSFIKRDSRLPVLFAKLWQFRHFIITNSRRKDNRATLAALGLSKNFFERILTIEETRKPKPDEAPFRLLLKITGLPADQHLYVGDREKVDIQPAKKLGMRTILVWGKSEIADLSIPKVYDIVKVLL